LILSKFPHYKQFELKDCGPTCPKIIAKYFGKVISIQELRKISETTRAGSSLLALSEASESLGFREFRSQNNTSKTTRSPIALYFTLE
jgi:ATP-binding cassette subfamily B protein